MGVRLLDERLLQPQMRTMGSPTVSRKSRNASAGSRNMLPLQSAGQLSQKLATDFKELEKAAAELAKER